MEGFWPIFFQLVVLKAPVLGALWLIWWAAQPPKGEYEPKADDGGTPKRWDPMHPRPRGPHGRPGGAVRRKRLRSHPSEPAPFGRSQVPLDGTATASRTSSPAEQAAAQAD